MTLPIFTEGTLYIDRDRDVRTGEWGPYVKIGIVREGKTTAEKVVVSILVEMYREYEL